MLCLAVVILKEIYSLIRTNCQIIFPNILLILKIAKTHKHIFV